jgi:hypothetical protein
MRCDESEYSPAILLAFTVSVAHGPRADISADLK